MATADTVRAEKSSEEPRERILLAAGREFAERGYEAATVRDICAAAGVNVAAVNYYFGDKRRLYIESVKHAHEQRIRQLPLPEWSAQVPPDRRLHDFVSNLLERMLGLADGEMPPLPQDAARADRGKPWSFGRSAAADESGDGFSARQHVQPPWQVRLMMREVLQPTEACRELVEDYMRPHFAVLVAILHDLAAGRLSEPELRRLAMSVVGQCFVYRAAGEVVEMLVPRDELETLHTPAALADHVTRQTLAALGAAAPLGVTDSRHRRGALAAPCPEDPSA